MLRNILLVALALAPDAMAALQVFPTRVTLSEKKRVAHLSLRHTGTKPGRYNISAVFYRMNPDGNLVPVTDAKDEERPAMKLIRFSPRKAVIPPNKEQIIRVIFSGPKSLPEGEYRAHIHFEPLDPPETPTAAPTKQGQISMAVAARIAVAVPVLYRQGNPEFKASLSDLGLLRLPDNTPAFRLQLASEGKAFAFGDFFAFFTPKGGQPQSVGVVRSVANYTKTRLVQFPLTIPEGLAFSNGTFRVEFRQPEDRGGQLLSFIEAPVK